jgi:hypothetical protein
LPNVLDTFLAEDIGIQIGDEKNLGFAPLIQRLDKELLS